MEFCLTLTNSLQNSSIVQNIELYLLLYLALSSIVSGGKHATKSPVWIYHTHQ